MKIVVLCVVSSSLGFVDRNRLCNVVEVFTASITVCVFEFGLIKVNCSSLTQALVNFLLLI